jgi:hypothetical protein
MTEEELCRDQIRLRLLQSDAIAAITDHGKRTEILLYRQTLRDFPATADFPDISLIPEQTW